MANPLSLPELPSLGGPLSRQVARVRSKKKKKDELAPEDRESLLSQIGTGVMSTVGYIGETLDKPGRALRGLLAGQPGELANLIPFSDTAGWTDPAKSVTGRQLFEKAGVLGPNQEGMDFGDALGFAAEVVLDPLNVVAIGPVKGAVKLATQAKKLAVAADRANDAYKVAVSSGKVGAELKSLEDAAKAAKQTAKAAAVKPMGRTPLETIKEIAAGERGLIGFKNPLTAWIPFKQTDAHIPQWATGDTAAKIKETLTYGNDTLLGEVASFPSRLMRHTFTANPFLKSMAGKVQKIADEETSRKFKAIDRINDDMLSVSDDLAEMGELKQHQLWMELQKHPQLMQQVAAHLKLDPSKIDMSQLGLSDFLTALGEQQAKGASGIVTLRQALDAAKAPENVASLADNYDGVVTRLLKLKDDLAGEYMAMGGSLSPLVDDFVGHVPRQMHPKLKEVLNRKSRVLGKSNRSKSPNAKPRVDPLKDVPGGTPMLQQISKDVRFNKASNPAYSPEEAAKLLQDEFGVLPDKAPVLAKYLEDMPPEIVSTGLYGDILQNVSTYSLGMARSNSALSAIHRLVADTAQQDDAAIGGVSLADALEQIGFSAKLDASQTSGVERAMQHFARTTGKSIDDTWTVPQQFVETAKKYWSYHTKPEEAEGFVGMLDKFNRMWKGGVTLPFPAFHNRNFISGQFTNAVTAYKNAFHGWQMLRKTSNALRGKDDQLLRELKQFSVLPDGVSGMLGDVLGDTNLATEAGVGQFGKVLNPLNSLGRAAENYKTGAAAGGKLKGASAVARGLGQWGMDANQLVEALNRGAHYAALRDRGWSPAAAAWSAKSAHFDYSQLSHGASFQSRVLRRVVPFYSYARFNLPFQLSQLLKSPAGPTARAIRLENHLRDEQEGAFVPRWLGQGLAVNTAVNKDGSRQYFVSHGLLPFEEAFNRFAITDGMPDAQRTLENFGGMTAPPFQWALEKMSGRQLWSHRPKNNLYPWPTDNAPINELLAQSPLSRVASTARTFTDERKNALEKAVNFLVGSAKFTDVDSQAINREIRDILKQRLENSPGMGSFSRPFAVDEGALTDEQRQQLSLYSLLMQEAMDAKKAVKPQ